MYIMNMDRCVNPRPVSIVCENELERGLIVCIEGMAQNSLWLDDSDDFEAYKVRLAKSGDEKQNLLIHSSVPFAYDERLTERDFVLEAGKVGRGHYITTGDEYTIAKELVGQAEVGNEVVLGADGKLAVGSENAIGIVVKAYDFNGQDSLMIRFY